MKCRRCERCQNDCTPAEARFWAREGILLDAWQQRGAPQHGIPTEPETRGGANLGMKDAYSRWLVMPKYHKEVA